MQISISDRFTIHFDVWAFTIKECIRMIRPRFPIRLFLLCQKLRISVRLERFQKSVNALVLIHFQKTFQQSKILHGEQMGENVLRFGVLTSIIGQLFEEVFKRTGLEFWHDDHLLWQIYIQKFGDNLKSIVEKNRAWMNKPDKRYCISHGRQTGKNLLDFGVLTSIIGQLCEEVFKRILYIKWTILCLTDFLNSVFGKLKFTL